MTSEIDELLKAHKALRDKWYEDWLRRQRLFAEEVVSAHLKETEEGVR